MFTTALRYDLISVIPSLLYLLVVYFWFLRIYIRSILVRFRFSLVFVGVLADGLFELLNTLGHPDDLLLEGSLLGLQVAHLLVETDRLSPHDAVVASDFLLHAVELVSQRLAGVLALHCQNVFEGLLLAAQDLDLFFVRNQILVQLSASFSEISKLTLKVSCVLRSLHLANSGITYKEVNISSLKYGQALQKEG